MLYLRRFYSQRWRPIQFEASKKDPGISKQRTTLGMDESLDDVDEDYFQDLETDFMGVNSSHRMHGMEMALKREKEKYLIVRRKYFKEKYPNFLTWQDKQQIRHLHNTDPEEWTIDRLSEGFPALPEIIERILHSNWSKDKSSQITRHDEAVVRNWNDFNKGKLNSLPHDLKTHLQKFSKRKLNVENYLEDKVVVTPKTQHGEFSQIITSYRRLQQEKEPVESDTKQISSGDAQLTVNEKEFSSKLTTYKQLKAQVTKKLTTGDKIAEDEKLINKSTLNTSEVVELSQEEINSIIEHKHQPDRVGKIRKTAKDLSHLSYPNRIEIPNHLYNFEATYKLNDCYYDSDGLFLYRVPGMM